MAVDYVASLPVICDAYRPLTFYVDQYNRIFAQFNYHDLKAQSEFMEKNYLKYGNLFNADDYLSVFEKK